MLIEEIIRLVDQTDGDIRHDLGTTRFAEIAKVAVVGIRLRRKAPDKQGLPTAFLPQPMLS